MPPPANPYIVTQRKKIKGYFFYYHQIMHVGHKKYHEYLARLNYLEGLLDRNLNDWDDIRNGIQELTFSQLNDYERFINKR